MPEDIRARDLMRASYLRLGAGHTLREAIGILLDPRIRQKGSSVLIILNANGSVAGSLTIRYVLRALAPEWALDDSGPSDPKDLESRLLNAVRDKLDIKVCDAMMKDLPLAHPDDRLPRLIEYMQDKRLDNAPVVENGRVVGVIYLTDVFNAAARLALSYGASEETKE